MEDRWGYFEVTLPEHLAVKVMQYEHSETAVHFSSRLIVIHGHNKGLKIVLLIINSDAISKM
jgi:hypothetical protein